ncbi:hypothetical protein [Rhodoflexus sp.]
MSKKIDKTIAKVHWDFDAEVLKNIRLAALKQGVSPAKYVEDVMKLHLESLPPIELKVAEDQSESQGTYKGVPLPY